MVHQDRGRGGQMWRIGELTGQVWSGGSQQWGEDASHRTWHRGLHRQTAGASDNLGCSEGWVSHDW